MGRSGILVLPGERFGKLTVLEVFQLPGKNRQCRVACDCGGHTIVWKHNLTSGHAKSCGCAKVEAGKAKFKHGHSMRTNEVSSTYKSWKAMKWRVSNPEQNPHYVGVTVCERWQEFEHFLADMGERPEGKTLDRIDPSGNYEPSNCRWATLKEQAENRKPWSHSPEGLKRINANRRKRE